MAEKDTSSTDIALSLAKLQVSVDYIVEDVKIIKKEVREFDHCMTGLETRFVGHLANHKSSSSRKWKIISLIIGAASVITTTLVTVLI